MWFSNTSSSESNVAKFYINKIKTQEQEIQELQDQLKILINSNQDLLNQNQLLVHENRDLMDQLNALKKRHAFILSQFAHINDLKQNLEVQNYLTKSELSNLQNAHKKLKFENFQLKNSIEKKDSIIFELKSMLSELSEKINHLENNQQNKILFATTINDFLNEHFKNSLLNEIRGKNYYQDSLKEIFTIISFVGKSWYLILQQFFNLPHYRTIQRYRNHFIQKYQFTIDTFNGNFDNLKKIIRLFTKEEDQRYVISIDAVSLKSYVSISSDGSVKGLKYIKKISIEYAKNCLENDNEFHDFIKTNKNQVENYIFTIYLCALGPNIRSFPVALIPDTHGNCTNDVLNSYLDIKKKLLELGINIIGNAFDGDFKYFDLLTPIYNILIDLKNYDFSLPFYEN